MKWNDLAASTLKKRLGWSLLLIGSTVASYTDWQGRKKPSGIINSPNHDLNSAEMGQADYLSTACDSEVAILHRSKSQMKSAIRFTKN
jgi:hypothetical protein